MLLVLTFIQLGICVLRKNSDVALRTLKARALLSNGTEKSESVSGRSGRRSAKRRKRRRRSGKRRRNGRKRENGRKRGSETENGSESGTVRDGRGEATPTVATPAERRRRGGADPATAGGLEAGNGTGNGSAAGIVDY